MWRPSEEHIVHASMGWTKLFATSDASFKYNSEYGTRIDAPFVELLPYAIKRQMLGIKNYSGDMKTIEFRVTPKGSGRQALIKIDPSLNVDVQILPHGSTTDCGSYTEYVFEGSPQDVERMFKGALAKAVKKGETLYAIDGQVLKDPADMAKASTRGQHSSFTGQVLVPEEVWVRGMCKMALGLGHVIIGPEWTFSASADNLRTVLELPYERCSDWVKRNLAFLPDPVATSLGIDERIRNDHLHTLAIIPKNRSLGPMAIISLFGGQAFRDVMINIGPDAGRLTTSNDTLDPALRIGVRINPADRSAEWINVAQWVQWSEPLHAQPDVEHGVT